MGSCEGQKEHIIFGSVSQDCGSPESDVGLCDVGKKVSETQM